MNLKKLFLMLTFFVLLGTTTFAQVYVSTGGDDLFGTGASATPYRTIQKAINVAPTGSTIYVEAGIYNSTLLPGEGNPISLTANRNFTFVGSSVGLNTTVELTAGFTLNNVNAVVNFGATGTAQFNFGTTATALVLTAGTMNITNAANVVLGNGATLTIGDASLIGVPTKGSDLNVIFNGANAISTTTGFLPSTLGAGTLTVAKVTGDVTIDNASLSVGNIITNNAANLTLSGNLTVASNGDITNSGTGTLTIGTNASNTLTMASTTALGQFSISNGTTVVNSSITYNVKNAGTGSSGGDTAGLAPGNVFNVTGGALTVNGNIAFNNTNVASSVGSNAVSHTVVLSNSGTGNITINGNITTPLSGVVFSAPTGGNNNAFINVIIANTNSGGFSVRNAALRGATGTPGVINNAAGLMTLGQSGDVFSTGFDVVQDNTGSRLVVNASSTFSGAFNNNATSPNALVTFNANATIAGLLTNAAKIKLNANTLTLSRGTTAAGAAVNALNNTGDIYSVTTAVVGLGAIKLTGRASTITGAGNLPNIEFANSNSTLPAYPAIGTGVTLYGYLNVTGGGTLNINAATVVKGAANMTNGSITLNANLTVEGKFSMPQGTFSFNASTLNLLGDFERTGGTSTVASAGTGTLNFAGASSQLFEPGVQFNVYNVTVNNTGPYLANVIANDVVTITRSIIVLKDFTINASPNGRVNLGTANEIANIRMYQVGTGGPGVSARFTNGGRGYSPVDVARVGGIIFEGTGANAAGALDGSVIAGTQPFSNIYVRLSVPGNNVFTLGAVKVSGIITFDSGGISWGAAADGGDAFNTSTLTLDDTFVIPTVVINTVNTHGSPFIVGGVPAVTSVYNLTYSGAVGLTMNPADFVTGVVNNLSIQAGTVSKTIQIFAANAAIVGNLNVDNGETLNLIDAGAVARTLTVSGNTATHTVNGTISGAGTTFQITGTGATLTGGVGTGNASAIAGTLLVNPATAGTFTSTGMKLFGALTINQASLVSSVTMNSATATVTAFTNTAGTTTLIMNSSVVSAAGNYLVTAGNVTLTMNGATAATRTIGTNLTVNGGSLTLGSAIDVAGNIIHGGGVIALGVNNLTAIGDYTHSGTGTITADTGFFISAPLAAGTPAYAFTTTVSIPNLRINGGAGSVVTVGANGFTVSNNFRMSAGTLALATFPFTIAGNTIRWDGGAITATGATGLVSLQGNAAVFTAYANVSSIAYLEVASNGTVTFATDDASTPTARNFNVTGAFTHTSGNIDLGINDLVLTDNGVANASFNTAATAGTLIGSTGSNLGEVVFNGTIVAAQNLAMADNYSIANIRTVRATTLTGSKVLTVINNFNLGGGNFSYATSTRLVLGNGATITRTVGVFDVVPTFGSTVNVTYNAALNTDVELPTSTTVLNNLRINGAVVFTTSATVNGTLFLAGGTVDLTTNSKVLTIADGKTINRSGGAFGAGVLDIPTVSTYYLIYSGTTFTQTSVEFVSSTTAVLSLTISKSALGVELRDNRTVGSFSMSPTGNTPAPVYFVLGNDTRTRTLIVTGTTTINNGIVSTLDNATPNISVGTLSVLGNLIVNGGILANLGADTGTGEADNGLNLSLAGIANQTITLADNTTVSNLTMNTTGKVTVSGGNLTVSNLLTFTQGILDMGTKILYLNAPLTGQVAAGTPSQGFTGANDLSHVVGNVAKALVYSGAVATSTEATSIFPVGTGTIYRPATLTFNPAFGQPTTPNATIVVRHVNSNPGGSQKLPIKDGVSTDVDVSRYPAFYWNIYTIGSVGTSTVFDLGLTAGKTFTDFDSPANVRIIRRHGAVADLNNDWLLQGTTSGYDNEVNSVTGFTAINKNSQGGLRTGGAVFTLGLKSNMSIKNPIPKQWLATSVGPIMIKLTDVFQGNTGNLSFLAQSSNTAVAKAEIISANYVKLTPVATNGQSAFITVTAVDASNNDFFAYTFEVDSRTTDVETVDPIPTEFALMQNFPNPFNPTTNIKFALPSESNVSLKIYNILGEEVANLINKVMPAGFHTYNFDATKLSSGMYIYRIEAGSFVQVKKMLLMK